MVKGKGKVVPLFFLTNHHTMKAYCGVEVQLLTFITSAIVGGGWSVSSPGRFIPGEIFCDTHQV